MAQHVSLLVFLHGVLTFQMKGVLGLSKESSDSSLGYRKGYYIVPVLPIQKPMERPEYAYNRGAVPLLALWPSSIFGAPDGIRPRVSTVAQVQLQPVPVISRPSASTRAPSSSGSTAMSGSVLTPSVQPKTSEGNREASAPGNLGTYCDMPARFSPTPQVLTTPGLPTKGAHHSTSSLTSSPTKEPRGDM